MAASDYDGRLPEPPYDTDTSAVAALQEECDRLAEQVKLLREVAEDARKELEAQATYFGAHLDQENNLFRILRKLEAALEAAKEGA